MSKLFPYSIEFIFRYFRLWKLREVSFKDKITFSFSVPASILRSLILKKKYINYLGNKFYYDDLTAPFTLLTYPFEVESHILTQIEDKNELTKILDIGGNVGQFSITMAKISNAKKIDVFEPNPEVFDLLKKNTSDIVAINLFNYGVGKTGKVPFYFRPNKSGTGSLIKENSDNVIDKDIKEVKIKLTSEVKNLTKNTSYDLIKIDVEGSEIEVLGNLGGLKTKYLYIEISANRGKTYRTSEIYELIKSKLGDFEVLFQDELHNNSVCFNILIHFP